MRKILGDLFALKMLRHRHHRNIAHRVGTTLLSVHRGRTMLVLGALGLVAEALRRRHQPKNKLPQLAD